MEDDTKPVQSFLGDDSKDLDGLVDSNQTPNTAYLGDNQVKVDFSFSNPKTIDESLYVQPADPNKATEELTNSSIKFSEQIRLNTDRITSIKNAKEVKNQDTNIFSPLWDVYGVDSPEYRKKNEKDLKYDEEQIQWHQQLIDAGNKSIAENEFKLKELKRTGKIPSSENIDAFNNKSGLTDNKQINQYLASLKPEERQKALSRINAPLTGEEIHQKAKAGGIPTLDEYARLEEYRRNQVTGWFEGWGEAANHIMHLFAKAGGSVVKGNYNYAYAGNDLNESANQATRNFAGMLAQAENPDSLVFKFRNAIFNDGSITDRYHQYLEAVKFTKDGQDLSDGKTSLIYDPAHLNHDMVAAGQFVADPSMLLPWGKVLMLPEMLAKSVGMAEHYAQVAGKISTVKNGIYAGTIKWAAGVPLKVVGGSVKNTIDFALDKSGSLFEAATGVSAREGLNYVKTLGFGTGVSDLFGYTVPIASKISQAYVLSGIAKGFGEALEVTANQATKQGFKRGANSFAKQALEESKILLAQEGKGISKHAQNLLTVLDKIDPMLIYAKEGFEGGLMGMAIGGGLGYAHGKGEEMWQGMGAGFALGGAGAIVGRGIMDLSGATRNFRYSVQAENALNVMKDKNPANHLFWRLMQKAYEKFPNDINKLIVSVDSLLPDVDFRASHPDEIKAKLKARGLDPEKYDGFEHEVKPDGTTQHKLDKDGKKIRVLDEEGIEIPTLEDLNGANGWIDKKGINGQTRIFVNLESFSKSGLPHEFGHGLFEKLVLKPEFQRRLNTYVLGEVDTNGNLVKPPILDKESSMRFFNRYLDNLHQFDKKTLADRKALLAKSLDEYYLNGKMSVMDIDSNSPYLQKQIEEFGAYYWTHFLKGQPVDFLFTGGDYGFARNMLEHVKNGYYDHIKGHVERVNGQYKINENAKTLDEAFLDKDGNRIRIPELDAFMKDMVNVVKGLNRGGSFDFSALSVAGQEAYIRHNGMERVFKKTANGKYKMMTDKEIEVVNKARGVEIYKAIDSLDPKLKVVRDAHGNVIGGLVKVNNEYHGTLSNEVLDHIVATGHMSQAEASKIKLFQDISLGKTRTNVTELTYAGLSAQTTTGAVDIRVYGDKVPIKNRKVLVLGVDNVFKPNGVFSSKASTLDWQVIDTRGKNLWQDPVVRQLWGGDRGAFEGDFYRYLENASKPKTDSTRVNNFSELWQADGAMKRNIMHQFAGLGKEADVPYANAPMTEIHWDINQSFMYLRIDRMSNIRLSNESINYNHMNAGHDISRNMMPHEMNHEKTPTGDVYTHASGFKFLVHEKGVEVFNGDGDAVGAFKNLDEAVLGAIERYKKDFPTDKPIPSFDNIKAEIVKPQFESKSSYIHNKFLERLKLDSPRYFDELKNLIKKRAETQDLIFKNNEKSMKNGGDRNADGQIDNNRSQYHENLRKNSELLKKVSEAIEKGDLSKVTEAEFKRVLDNYLGDTIDNGIGVMHNSREIARHVDIVTKDLGKEWDSKYPMKFRSPLDDAIKSWFANGKTMTAQQLLKKLLRVGSSRGIQVWTEANNIGLIKHLKSKIKPTEHIHRTINPETGNYYPRGTPDAPTIKTYSGEQQVPLDSKEILRFMDDNKITLTIEENAKEVSGLDTERFTADGEREGYRETALRINPQYRHGITGHYDQAVAHLRTSDRVDSVGERTNFMEESQANNTDSTSRSVNPVELKKNHDRATKENKLIQDGQYIEKLTDSRNHTDTAASSLKSQTTEGQSVEDAILYLIESSEDHTTFTEAFTDYTSQIESWDNNRTPVTMLQVKNYANIYNTHLKAWKDNLVQYIKSIPKSDWETYLSGLQHEHYYTHPAERRTGSGLLTPKEIANLPSNLIDNIVKNNSLSQDKLIKMADFILKEFTVDTSRDLRSIFVQLGTIFSRTKLEKLQGRYTHPTTVQSESVGNKLIKDIRNAYKEKLGLQSDILSTLGLSDYNGLVDNVLMGYQMFNGFRTARGILEFAGVRRIGYGDDFLLRKRLSVNHDPNSIGQASYFDFNDVRSDSGINNMNFGFIHLQDFGGWRLRDFDSNKRVLSTIESLTQHGDMARQLHKEFVGAYDILNTSNTIDPRINLKPVERFKKRYREQQELMKRITDEWNLSGVRGYQMSATELSPARLSEIKSDNRSSIQQYLESINARDLPFLSVEDWGLHLIKMQIREAIQKGQKKLTITHPDDSPTKSHMDESRYALYGKILPDLARGFLKRWGIEIKQDLKLHSSDVSEKHLAYATKATETSHLNAEALRIFNESKSSESAGVINELAQILAMPVQDLISTRLDELTNFYKANGAGNSILDKVNAEARSPNSADDWRYKINKKIEDGIRTSALETALKKVVESKASEWSLYGSYLKASEAHVKGKISDQRGNIGKKLQTQYAIDRGHSYYLNDAIIRDFIRNDEGTAMRQYMPKEVDGDAVARVVNKEEYARMMAIVHAVPHLKAAYDKGDLTFDKFQHSKYRKYHVLTHGLDNASTRDWIFDGEVVHNAQGGGNYPAYRSPEAWAATSPAMAEAINRIGALNLKEHGEWIAPVMFTKAHNEKTMGTPNGSIAYVKAMNILVKNFALGKNKLNTAIVDAFASIGEPINYAGRTSNQIIPYAISLLADKSMSMDNRRIVITKINSAIYKDIKYSNNAVNKLLPSLLEVRRDGGKVKVGDLLASVFEMTSDPMFKHAKAGGEFGGDIYGMLMFDSETVAREGDWHDSYTHSIIKKDGTPVKVDYLTTPISPEKLLKSATKQIDAEKGTYGETDLNLKNKTSFYWNTGQSRLPLTTNRLKMPKEVNDPNAGKIIYEPRDISWLDVGHYPNEGDQAQNVWENKNSGLWADFDGKITTKNPQEWDRPDFTHAEWFLNLRHKHKPTGGDRRLYSPESSGRYENPKYDADGKLTEKGKITVTSLTDREYTMDGLDKDIAYYTKVKEDLASKLGFPAKDYDAYLFRPSKKIQKEMGIDLNAFESAYDEYGYSKAIKYMPKEKFVGKYAEENPKLIKDLKISVRVNKDDKMTVDLLDPKDNVVGAMSAYFSKTDNSALVSGTHVETQYRGKGLGNLLYSETMERLRALGMREVSGMVIDSQDRPIKIRKKIIDEQNRAIGNNEDYTTIDDVREDGDYNHQKDVTSWLDKNARYMPKDFADGLKGLIDAVDAQSGQDKVPEGIKKGIQMLAQAIKQQGEDDVNAGIIRGVQALNDAIDSQSNADRVPEKIKAGVKKLIQAAQSIPKPVKKVKQPRATTNPAPAPETQPVFNQNNDAPENNSRWKSYTQETTSDGNIYTNMMGYIVMQINNKFKVYSPAKELMGIYDSLDEGKRKIQKEADRLARSNNILLNNTKPKPLTNDFYNYRYPSQR